MLEKTIQLKTTETGIRLDHFVTASLEGDLSRSYIQKLIKTGNISVNGQTAKANNKLQADDEITVTIPEAEKCDITAHDLPLDIVYEDADIAVINKQPGVTVHPGTGTHNDTLVNALLFHITDLSSIGGVERPGIVHRLDRDTAGLMVIAKNDNAHRTLSKCFSDREIGKEYAAIVRGKPKTDHFTVDKPIARHPMHRHKMSVQPGGRESLSEFFYQQGWNGRMGVYTLLRAVIHTGRTHQIRVHLSASGVPIAGDPLYSRQKTDLPFLMLASVKLSFNHPQSGKPMTFEIPLPPHMQQFIDKLNAAEDISDAPEGLPEV